MADLRVNPMSDPVFPTAEALMARCRGFLPDLFGITITALEAGRVETVLTVRPEFLAPNGFLHAATLVALADTSCGLGTLSTLADGASFTTMELKTNFLGTVLAGDIACVAVGQHLGRTTQLWDAEVREHATGKRLALFRCTQLILGAR
jgi:uncharacterized protein (TIGR00369 family)